MPRRGGRGRRGASTSATSIEVDRRPRAARAGPLRRGRGRDRGGHRPAAGDRRADRRRPAGAAARRSTRRSAPRSTRRCASGVSVLTGGPGTGKSRTVATVVALAEAAGQRSRSPRRPAGPPSGSRSCAAPRRRRCTGCSARRRGSRRRRVASTAGSPAARSGRWTRTSSWSTRPRCSTSSSPTALLEACADGTHLLLVGDAAQLPSIGPGRVLGDVIDSGVVPATELTTLYRQAEGGAIARLATAVRGGELPRGRRPDPRGRGRRRRAGRRGGAPGRPAGHRLDPAGARHRRPSRCRS